MPPPEAKSEAPRASPPGPQGPLKPDAGRPAGEGEGGGDGGEKAGGGHARWIQRGTNALVLGLVSLCCAYLLTPGLYTQRIEYGEESLGHFSNKVIKAGRDYNIPDEETTRRKRDEARDAVLPVHDYDLAVADSALERVRSAFQLMQEAAREVEATFKEREAAEPRPVVEARKAPPVPVQAQGTRALARADEPPPLSPLQQQKEEALTRAFESRREEWQRRLETQLDEESFRAFASRRFSEESQREVERLLARVSGQMVAEYRDPLALAGTRGVVVRRRSGTEVVSEKVVTDVSHIRDQSELRLDSERWAFDLAPDFTPAQRRAVITLVTREVRANLRFNREETDERRRHATESVKPVVIQLKKGERIIGDGERIEHRHLVIFKAIKAQAGSSEDRVLARLGFALFSAVLVLVVHTFARQALPRFRPTRKDALLGALSLVLLLALVNVSVTISDATRDRFPAIPPEAFYLAIPFAAGAMLLRFVLTAEAAVVFAVIFAGLSGVLLGNSLQFGLYSLLGSLAAAAAVARAKDRAALFKAGAWTGGVNAALVLCFALIGGRSGGDETLINMVAGFLGGALFVPILVMGFTPLVEAAFGYTTDIKLLELANLNHPALKELIVQAPGTYHHSIILGSLAEAGAEAISANPLLARVCAYYHDIGKGRNPLYFGENQKGENRHDKLAPAMSALIIKRHVTEGLEMAREYKLPKLVADAIPQHHGTRLVGYFYFKALKEQEGRENPQPIDDALYRYPGPKPQFPEAALVMMADAVEASCRAMPDPTPQKLQAQVQKIINGVFADGQLDECELTLRDLNDIARAFYRTLGGIYHSRPEYPPGAVAPGRPALTEVKDGKPQEPRLGATPPPVAPAAPAAAEKAEPLKKAQGDR